MHFGRVISEAKQAVKIGVHRVLQPLETSLREPAAGALEHVPVFIVGPPRTGSTLLYQLLVRRYRFCYISNLLNRFSETPLALAKLSKAFGGFDAADDFSSRYGDTVGWCAPSQGRECWARWLPESPNALAPDAVANEAKEHVRSTISALQRICGRPFVNKWQPNSVRVRLLSDIFPQALFVRISRSTESTVRSILRGREELCRRGSGWFSVKPPGYRRILNERRPEEQAAWQIAAIEHALDVAGETVGAHRFVHVRYEQLTRRPRQVLDRIAAFYEGATRIELERRCEVPEAFRPHSAPR